MSELIFDSQFYSLSGIDYRVRLYGKTYIGFDAPIIGGIGTVFYVADDWTDYLENGQAITVVGASDVNDIITGFTYNSVDNRTEITLATETYTTQTSIKNDIFDQGGFIPNFDPVIQKMVSNYSNSDDYILSPLMTSSTEITYANVRESRTEVDTAFFDRFIGIYLQSDDDELRLTVERNDGGYVLEWAGNIVMDLIEWDNNISPRPYLFKAIDGIDRIKDVPYNGDLAALANKKIKDIILDVLALNGLDEFWGTNDIYIRDTIEYQSIDVVSVTAGDSPLDYSYLYENILIDPDDDAGGDYVFRSGYDILKGLMELFSARLIHTKGAYYIQQIRNYDTTAITTRNYVKAGTYASTTYTHSNDTLRVRDNGKFGYLYGIKRATIETENKDVLNIGTLPFIQPYGVQFDNTSLGEMVIVPPIYQNIGDIKGGLAANQYINLQFYLNTIRLNVVDLDLAVRLVVRDTTTNYRFLKGSDTIAPYWAEGAIIPNQYYEKKLSLKGGVSPKSQWVNMVTPIIPYEMEDVEISLEIHILNIRKQSGVPVTIFELSNLLLIAPKEGSDINENIFVDNPNVKFTKDLDLGNLIINEGNAAVQVNNISVDGNYKGGAIDYKIGGLWDADFDVNGTLSVSRVLEAMSLQFKPLKTYMGMWDGKYYPFQTIPYDNSVFAAKEITIDYAMDDVSGEWFEVLTSRVGISSNEIGNSDVYNPDDLGDAFVQSQNNSVGVGTIRGDITPATGITTIAIDSIGDVKVGDKIQVIGPTGDVYLDLVANENLETVGSDVTLDVLSFDTDVEIPSGSRIIYGYKQMYFSETVRVDNLQHTGVETIPTSLTDMRANEVRFVTGDVFIKSGTTIYKLTGIPYIESSDYWVDDSGNQLVDNEGNKFIFVQ